MMLAKMETFSANSRCNFGSSKSFSTISSSSYANFVKNVDFEENEQLFGPAHNGNALPASSQHLRLRTMKVLIHKKIGLLGSKRLNTGRSSTIKVSLVKNLQ